MQEISPFRAQIIPFHIPHSLYSTPSAPAAPRPSTPRLELRATPPPRNFRLEPLLPVAGLTGHTSEPPSKADGYNYTDNWRQRDLSECYWTTQTSSIAERVLTMQRKNKKFASSVAVRLLRYITQ